MIQARIDTASSCLIVTADNSARSELADAYALGGYPRAEMLVIDNLHEAFELIDPAALGALTDAPILMASDDTGIDDDGARTFTDGAPVYWYPNYCISDPWEALKNTGRVVFPAGSKIEGNA
ncbi:hypothetical protein LAV_00215 [Sphingobium phage Lacusarx]|uniref:Uncharacterized protein n=1 Tax=Sphingobium phage Lacusarx TaxID=1980139 RepID=A0A1W6DX51_9CAUD|nr:hypothetical protein FDH44_gp088 [Sphingobium phage Lacusarx]ARK07590.1 hypothetical protein LAV_00215 [Sphingobium phage Lacusarx]